MFLQKMKYCDFCREGQVLSPSPGQPLSLTLFMISGHITYKQPLQMIMEPTCNQGFPDCFRNISPLK